MIWKIHGQSKSLLDILNEKQGYKIVNKVSSVLFDEEA